MGFSSMYFVFDFVDSSILSCFPSSRIKMDHFYVFFFNPWLYIL